jgi:hypothetical protein
MANEKVRTPDVVEIFDTKIKATNAHAHIGTGVSANATYDSILAQIASSSPTLAEKQAFDAAQSPGALNPFVTFSDLAAQISDKIPWKTIGPTGSSADFQGNTDAIFTTAFASGAFWFQVLPATYTFSASVAIPAGVKVVGVTTSSTIITGNIASPLFTMGSSSYLSFITISQQNTSGSALGITANAVSLEYMILSHASTSGTLINAVGVTDLKMFTCVSQVASSIITSCSNSFFHGCLFDAPTVYALDLQSCINVTLTASIFKNGQLNVLNSTNVKAVSNHFNSGLTVTTSPTTLLRANTPDTVNNESDDFLDILTYIGSPSLLATNPIYSNNYAGPPGEDLTARASALDLLVQWRYEERNFHLVAQSEPTTISWNQTTNLLTSTGPLFLQSSHRASHWVIPTLNITVPNNSVVYYVLDRNLNTSPITLTPQLASIGTVPNNTANQQVWVLAFALNNGLWWRGGRGTRFPATGTQVGQYFVDGSSKSLLDYIGSPDYNASQPNYANNFSGVNGENLVTRINHTDQLIRTLYQNTNVGTYLSDTSYISVEPGTGSTYALTLSGTFYMAFPNVAGRIFAANLSWNLADQDIIYFTLNLGEGAGSLAGADTAIIAATQAAAGALPLPDNYPNIAANYIAKYFVFARRVGTSIFLWDNSELPVGGRYPEPIGRSVVAINPPSVLVGGNTQWDGTNFLWEGLAVAVATGANINRNTLANQTTALPSLTDLTEGTGLLLTHTWNSVPATPQNVQVSKVPLPLTYVPLQNQFLWVQRRNGIIMFTEG